MSFDSGRRTHHVKRYTETARGAAARMAAGQDKHGAMQMQPDDGYVKEIDYTHGYCAELAPALLDLACIARGISGLPSGRPIRYLEIAFGQGVPLNLHAAACPGEYWGFDFNPAHAANARALTAASGSGAILLADSFAQFAARQGGPQFDVVAMHGTWSWISAENRRLVVEIVREKLAPGGLFYVSYNCSPGWATEIPLRHLLVQHAEVSGSGEALTARIDASLAFAQSLGEAGARFFETHPRARDWLENMRGRSRQYLAHEYFNRDWHPMPFSDVASALAAADVTFAAPATASEYLDGLALPAAARKLLEGIHHPVLRQTTLDFFINRRFRRDVFVKEPNTLEPDAREQRLRATPFVLLQAPGHVALNLDIAGGTVALGPEVAEPFLAAMAAADYAAKTLDELAHCPQCRTIAFADLAHAALMLTGAGSLHPAQSKPAIEKAAPRCKALNAYLLDQAALGDSVPALASPVTGAGVFMARQELLFLRARALGLTGEDDWASDALERIEGSDLQVLRANARAFARFRLPVLKALGIA
jgi:SAM-dependent methyltransferase